jgi:pyruvate dehydrogenase (quinone)
MACGLPGAVAAAIAHPRAPGYRLRRRRGLTVLMGELATCDVNNSLGQIKWEQMVFLGDPEYGCDLQPIDRHGGARLRSHGFYGR